MSDMVGGSDDHCPAQSIYHPVALWP